MIDMYDKIGDLLKSKKINRRQLAETAGIPYSSLTSAFNRKSKSFSYNYIQKIADALGIPISELLHDEKIPYLNETSMRAINVMNNLGVHGRHALASSIANGIEWLTFIENDDAQKVLVENISQIIRTMGIMIEFTMNAGLPNADLASCHDSIIEHYKMCIRELTKYKDNVLNEAIAHAKNPEDMMKIVYKED